MTEGRGARVQSLLALIAAQPANSPAQLALLSGASGRKGQKAKLIQLDAKPDALAQLSGSADAKAKPLVAALNVRISWPNKPGVIAPAAVKPLSAAEQKLFDAGKVTYTTFCAACHQPNGQGMEGLAPPLVDSEWVNGSPDNLPRILTNGLTGPLKVKGTSWSLEMPPIGAALTDEQVAGVLTYIRREWEHTASPISVEEVTKVRAQLKDRTKAWTMGELKQPSAPAKDANSSTQASN
jgi:mono/diheme cytochrome c family protein